MYPIERFKLVANTTFVLNNLTQEQLSALDDNYPDVEEVDQQLLLAVGKHGVNISLRLDKNGNYICFLNQGEYTASARSSSLYDALVIALYKLNIAGYELASVASKTTHGFQRG
jgi:hypothetical protein